MLNQIVLIGRLTRDPELKYLPGSGKAVANFTLASDRTFTNADGERETDFIPIVTWGKSAENCAKYIFKGSMVAVVGRLQIREYEGKEGKRKATEVVAENVRFLDSKKSQSDPSAPINDEEPLADSGVPF